MPESVATPTRERLLTSGALLFAEKGFDGVSVRAICKHAQTSNNMVHHYFKSKAGLREAIIEQFSLAVFAVPMRLLATPARSADDFAARMEMLFATIVEAYMEHRTILMVVTREQADLPALADFMDHFTAFLERGKDAGFVRKELDTRMLTGALHDRILNQAQFAPWIQRNYGLDLKDPAYKKRWCASNIDLFLNGLLARSPTPWDTGPASWQPKAHANKTAGI